MILKTSRIVSFLIMD